MFSTYFVTLADLAGNLIHSLPTFQTTPDQHRRLVQSVVALGVQIDEHGFTAVKLGIDNMIVWTWGGCRVQVFLFQKVI